MFLQYLPAAIAAVTIACSCSVSDVQVSDWDLWVGLVGEFDDDLDEVY